MQEVLLSSRELFGDEDLLTLVSMRTLGELYENRDELRAARKVLEHALAASRTVLGEEHKLTLAMMTSLATVRRRQGDLRGALDLQEPAFRISRQLLGEEHLFTLRAMDDLAEILKDQGNDGEARDLREFVVEARGKVLGREHPETLKAVVNLAAVLYKLGHYERARELDEKALSLMRDRLGEEHPWTLIVMDNLAAVRFAQRDLAGARELQERVLPALQRLQGEYHTDTLLAMNNLAITIAGQGDLIGARILQEHTLDKSRRTLGPEHFDTLRAKVNLASILKSQGIGGTGVERRCVHCLQPLEKRTADHIFPRSWYPKGTAESVQRWTAPSCQQCNKRLGAAEKDLMVSLAMCGHDSSLDSSDISERALRAVAIGTAGLSEKEQAHREKYRRKILSRVLPYFAVKHISQTVHGASSEKPPLGELEPVMVITLDLVSPVAEKIVRGLEFKLAGRYIEPPLSLKTFIVPVERVHEWDDVFEKTTELQFGPGFKVFRAVPNASDVIVMYRIVIWETLTVHVAVGQFGT